jgi:hypothetical protein
MAQVRSDQFLIYWGTDQPGGFQSLAIYVVFLKFSSKKKTINSKKKIVIGNICGIVVN